jgi:hypothetical protein
LILGGTTGAAALSQGVELVRRLATFTVNPAELLASQSRAARLPELDKQTSVRFRFAREFLDFCEAFKPRNLIVFIDDLDRCNPETTAMILECVNYLVSSGDCYIVFGMDYDRVRACIAQAYGSEARTMAELRGGVDNPTASLREFADRYLEKLVNLRIPLPRATATQRAALVVTSGADAEGRDESPGRSPSWLVQLPQSMARAIPVRLAAALVLCLGVAMLYWLPRAPSAVNSMGGPPSGGSPGTGGIPQVAGIEPTWDWPPRAVATTTTSVTGARASAVAWFLIGLGLAVLLASILMQMFTPDMGVIQDSPAFEQALRDWLPLLETKAETPRALKRFMNELRYLAMLQEPAAPRLTPWEYLLGLLGLYRPPAAATNGQCIEESSLVGLAVLHHRFPAWPASSEQIKSQAMELLNAHAVPSAKQEELRPKVAEMASHSDRFLRLLGVAKFQ